MTDQISYRVLTGDELDDAYARLAEQDLMWALFPEMESISLCQWREIMAGPVLILGGFIGGRSAGYLSVRPFMGRTLCGEVGVTALRPWFSRAARLSRGAFLWAFRHLDCVSLVGRVAAPNRHILRMAPEVGFRELGRIPGMCWHARKRKFVDGVLLLATPESVRESMEPRQEDVGPRSGAKRFPRKTRARANPAQDVRVSVMERTFVDGVLLLATPESVRASMEPRQEDVEPRSAAEAKTALFARRSECRPGRPTERHGEDGVLLLATPESVKEAEAASPTA